MTTIALPHFGSAHILVIGDIMLDRYGHGDASRISPEAPVPIVKVQHIEERAGGAGNVALNIHALGAQVSLISLVGADQNAEIIEKTLQKTGVRTFLERTADAPTITKLRIISQNQQLIRLDFEKNYQHIDKINIIQRFREHLSQADIVILSDYNKGTLSDTSELITLAKQANVPILVDPKGHDFSRYQGASLLTPNLKEFEAIAGPCRTQDELIRKGQQILEQYQLKALLITQGNQGMTLLQKQADALHLAAHVREVYDVAGAGDTVIATLASAFASGASLPEATRLANLAASIVVGHLGASTVSLPELRHALHHLNGEPAGIVTAQELHLIVDHAKAQAKRVVLADGYFDHLTSEDIHFLQGAKKLGDRLIAAVYCDDKPSSNRNLQHRISLLAALSCVDWVIPCTQRELQKIVKDTQPDVWAIHGTRRQHISARHTKIIHLPSKQTYHTETTIQ